MNDQYLEQQDGQSEDERNQKAQEDDFAIELSERLTQYR